MPKTKAPKRESVGDLTENEAMEDIGGLDPGETPDNPGKDHNPGRGIYRTKLKEFALLKDEDKHHALRETWKEVAMGAATRAKAFVATCSPKDFGALQRLIISGAVSLDKAFPPKQEPLGPKFIVNMFGSLGQRAASIATPDIPTIDVTAKEIEEWPSSSSTNMITLSPIAMETSTMTKPSTP
jgi:hypothetical protein